jgi:hypothetical protein
MLAWARIRYPLFNFERVAESDRRKTASPHVNAVEITEEAHWIHARSRWIMQVQILPRSFSLKFNMELFTLLYGKSKKRMHPIMTDDLNKCKNYMKQREHSVPGWHEIVPANKNENVWRQKSATVGGNQCEMVNRVGHGPNGYISKTGFNAHT